ncbi:MAG: DNA polymerase III subunit gamma and tau, partial [Protaetiibacter sp.]
GVLPLVVRAGGGSVRDTLSLLDQLIAGSEGSTVRYERAVALLGYTHGALLDEIVDSLAARDAQGVFAGVDRVIQTGQDPRRFVDDLLERLRDLIVVAATRDDASAVLRGVPVDEIERMQHQAAAYGPVELSRAADIVNSALTEMTGATSPRLHLELMAARLLVPSSDESERGTLARVERLERRIGIEGADAVAALATERTVSAPTEVSVAEVPLPEHPPAETAGGAGAAGKAGNSLPPEAERAPAPTGTVTLQQLRDAWPEILDIVQGIKRGSWMVVYTSTPRAYDAANEVLTLSFASDNDVQSFRQAQGAGESVSEHLRQAIVRVLGVRVKFIARVEGAASDAPAPASAVAPPAAEVGWNVTPIPSSASEAPVVPSDDAPPPDDVPPPADDDAPPHDEEPARAPAPTRRPESSRVATAGEPDATATADDGLRPAPKRAAGRYGEAVVREVLKASFIEEVQLTARDRSVRLVEEQAPPASVPVDGEG